jgi:hypothetical protein
LSVTTRQPAGGVAGVPVNFYPQYKSPTVFIWVLHFQKRITRKLKRVSITYRSRDFLVYKLLLKKNIAKTRYFFNNCEFESGKSVFINPYVISILFTRNTEQVILNVNLKFEVVSV